MTEEKRIELQRFALQIRIGIVDALKARGFGHIGGSLSAMDILTTLYFNVMQVDPANPQVSNFLRNI